MILLLAGPGEPTTAVRDALGPEARVAVVRHLEGATALLARQRVAITLVVWPLEATDVAALVALRHSRDVPSPLLVLVPPEMVADRRALTESSIPYLPVPVDAVELRLVIDRMELDSGNGRIWLGDICLDRHQRRVTRAGRVIDLTRREFDLFDHLVRNRRIVQTKDQLLDSVWGSVSYNPNVVEVTISSLRRKLEALGPRVVQTVRGVGYLCQPPDERHEPPLLDLMEQRRRLLADRQRLLEQRDAILAKVRAMRETRAELG